MLAQGVEPLHFVVFLLFGTTLVDHALVVGKVTEKGSVRVHKFINGSAHVDVFHEGDKVAHNDQSVEQNDVFQVLTSNRSYES